MSEDSPLVKLLAVFVGSIIILAVFAPMLIPLDTTLFVYFLVDHIEGLIAGAIVGAFLSPKTGIAGIPIGAILGIILQYLLFH